MDTRRDPREIAETILQRSICAVRVGAVIVDSGDRVIGWGWNSAGPTGMGIHAEDHCIRRANRARVAGATIYVASERGRNGRAVTSKPCAQCQRIIRGVGISEVYWRDADGTWRSYVEDMD